MRRLLLYWIPFEEDAMRGLVEIVNPRPWY